MSCSRSYKPLAGGPRQRAGWWTKYPSCPRPCCCMEVGSRTWTMRQHKVSPGCSACEHSAAPFSGTFRIEGLSPAAKSRGQQPDCAWEWHASSTLCLPKSLDLLTCRAGGCCQPQGS